jgi:hypothetical protein
MAFAPDIRGVWRTDGTWEITSIPRKMERIITKIASLYNRKKLNISVIRIKF